MDEYSNKIANYFKAKGLRKDDTVCLILENRPEYIGIWMGLSKLGVVTALINTNLTADPLIHCLNVSKAKAIVHGGSHEKSGYYVCGIWYSKSKIYHMKIVLRLNCVTFKLSHV